MNETRNIGLEIDTSEMRTTMKAMIDKYEEDDSIIDVMKFIAQRHLSPNSRQRIFTEWLCDNINGLEVALEALGLEVEEGPGFAGRLEEAVMSVLQPGTIVVSLDELLDEPSEELKLSFLASTGQELKQT